MGGLTDVKLIEFSIPAKMVRNGYRLSVRGGIFQSEHFQKQKNYFYLRKYCEYKQKNTVFVVLTSQLFYFTA